MPIEALGWFMLGAGSALWLMTIYNIYRKIMENRRNIITFDKMIEDTRQTADILAEIAEAHRLKEEFRGPLSPEASERTGTLH